MATQVVAMFIAKHDQFSLREIGTTYHVYLCVAANKDGSTIRRTSLLAAACLHIILRVCVVWVYREDGRISIFLPPVWGRF